MLYKDISAVCSETVSAYTVCGQVVELFTGVLISP